ncbi:uncharacterized protein EI97DRAFT_419713 [Westerdykella ornata]|uniref:DUF676 domain-containing protein n=1 Tax=Westerdykella ornata TaxID=318751 RepID=A0A6A6JHV5_WESOR|nr:uncharacterized protein EI97DRAFT_419713 [Westerdykella ornata]KAF2275977.1 hypothetical protein EI97DRAFT_419713 [Westerdykella ornata]
MGIPVDPVGLTVLSNPQDAIVDVVFVHGLQGHPRKTWCSDPTPQGKQKDRLSQSDVPQRGKLRVPSPFRFLRHRRKGSDRDEEDNDKAGQGEGVFWPEDLLKADCPRARIMTFGYNTHITQGFHAANQNNLFAHARDLLYALEGKRRQSPNRALIFLAHSLGGILVKEVLRRSEVDPDEKVKAVYTSTIGVFFFGTPHRGSKDWASFGEGVATVATYLLGVDVNRQVIHALLPTGPELELCRESFTNQWVKRGKSLTVRTFQESKALTGVRLGGFNQLVCMGLVQVS